jgi:hypothetical protein
MENIKIFDMSSDELYELINNTKLGLINKNLNYKKLKNEVLKIVKQYPNIDKVFDTKSTLELTKDECKMLQRMMDLFLKIHDIEEHEILFLGGQISYIYFKKIGIIKD